MTAIESEAIADLRYEAQPRWLFVRFTSGEWYAYHDVAPEVFAAFEAAPSKGRFFRAEVRDRYAFTRLPDP